MNKVVAVVVTYNRLSLLKSCIESLKKQSEPCDIFVVNNASTDETSSYLLECSKNSKNINYENLDNNIGGSGGFNRGMKWAVKQGYEYVWVMDDDCIPNKDALKKLVEADKILGGTNNYGFLSSTVLWKDGQQCVMNRQKIIKKANKYNQFTQYNIQKISHATFVSMFIPTNKIIKYGLPIKEYFIWGDDIEFSTRLSIKNKENCYLVGQSIVTHMSENNCGSDISRDSINRMKYYKLAYRNENHTYRKLGFKGFCRYLARCARGFIYILIYSKDNRLKRIGTLFSGFFKGFVFNPKIEYISK